MEQCQQHSGLESELVMLKESDKLQWIAIDKIKDRIPDRGVIAISILMFLLGAAFTFASMAIKIAEMVKKP
jgi:hypothetical protein